MPGMPALRATTWPQLVEEFLVDRRAHGLKDRSLEFYQYGIERFLLWAAESGVAPADFEARHLRAFLAWLQMTGSRARDRRKGQRLAPRTLHAYSRVVRALHYFGGREGMLEAVPVMQMPRVPRPDPEYLREDEIDRLREVCRDPRDRVLIELMLDTGLRRGEFCRLTWGDLAPDGSLVRVRVRHEKGDRPRVTYCTLDTWRHLVDACSPGDSRQSVFGLTPDGLQQMLRRLGEDRRNHPLLEAQKVGVRRRSPELPAGRVSENSRHRLTRCHSLVRSGALSVELP